jgi:hypothetical protein
MKNIKESIKFDAYMLLSNNPPVEYMKLLEAYFINPNDETQAALKQAEPRWMTQEFEAMKIEAHKPVNVTMTLGSVLFDLYIQATIKNEPKAPLAKVLYLNKRNDYGKLLSSDEFEIPQELRDLIKDTLLDDAKWDATNLSATLDNGVELNIRAVGLQAYKQIMTELIQIYA